MVRIPVRSTQRASAFSWRRTSAITLAATLHGVAFLLITAPLSPPEARAHVAEVQQVIVDISQPPPVMAPQPPPPEPPSPPVQRPPVTAPDPPAAVVAEPAPRPLAAVPPPPTDTPQQRGSENAPRTDLAVRVQRQAIYPRRAIAQRQEGTVLLLVRVTPHGLPAEVRVERSSGYPLLDRAARQAVAQWQFSPGMRAGAPVEVWARVPVHFNLQVL